MNFSQPRSQGELVFAMARGAVMGLITPSRLMSPSEIEAAIEMQERVRLSFEKVENDTLLAHRNH